MSGSSRRKEADIMADMSIAQAAEKWGVSERSVRNYCAQGRVPGAYLEKKSWRIPRDAEKPKCTGTT